MSKWYGIIGFAETVKTAPGVYEDNVIEKHYIGTMAKNYRRIQNSGGVNDDVRLSNELSIFSDSYTNENIGNIKYVVYMGSKWKVENTDAQFPKLILSLGGVYNGK